MPRIPPTNILVVQSILMLVVKSEPYLMSISSKLFRGRDILKIDKLTDMNQCYFLYMSRI